MLTAIAIAVLGYGPFPIIDIDREVAVFTAPLLVPGALMATALFPNGPGSDVAPMAVVPLGVAFQANAVEWVVDAALIASKPSLPLGAVRGHFGFWLAAGPVVHSGREPLNGFFFNPKVGIGVFQSAGVAGPKVWEFNITAGGDFGYQLVWRRLYFSFLVGASIGVGMNETDSLAGPLIQTSADFPPANPGFQLVGGVNVQFIRVGYAF